MNFHYKDFLAGIALSMLVIFASKAQLTNTVTATGSCQDDGTITVSMTNGTMPYSIVIYNYTAVDDFNYNDNSISSGPVNQNSYTFIHLKNGVYNIIVTDNNGTETSNSVTVSSPITPNFTHVADNCNGDGSITATPTGGTAPYTFLWHDGSTNATVNNQQQYSQNYVTITDAAGCIFHSDSLYTSYAPDFALEVSSTDASCNTKGTATINVTGASGPYTYYWQTSPIQTTATATTLDGDQSYTVVVTNSNGCHQQTSVYVSRPSNEFDLAIAETAATCNQSNGSASATPSNGTAPYTYLWSTSETTSSITGLTGNTYYSVEATDANGCRSEKSFYLSLNSPLQLNFTNTNAPCQAAGGSISAIASNGTEPYTYQWGQGETTSSLSNLTTGDYYLNVTDANGCGAYGYAYVAEDASCSANISGVVFIDDNENGVMDAGELPVSGINVYFSNEYGAFSDANGNYSTNLYAGTYSIQAYAPYGWHLTTAPISISVTGGNAYPNQNIGIAKSISLTDVYIYSFSDYTQRPGKTYDTYIGYYNEGTNTESGTVTYTFSDGWDLVTASPTPDNYDATTKTATWNYNSLTPFKSGQIHMTTTVPIGVSIGTVLTGDAVISTVDPDNYPNNNESIFNAIVKNSYDPNDIRVSPQGTGTAGYISSDQSSLTYKIDFQNTGTDAAYNVIVTNDLDANMDNATVTVLSSSHPCTSSIENNTLKFSFKDINLPDSNANQSGSHGYVLYRVNLKNGLAPDTKIFNEANIYFDYNSAVATNQVQNTIARVTGTLSSDETSNVLVLYPNPCNNVLNIRLNNVPESKVSVQLYAASGQQVVLMNDAELSQGSSLNVDLTPYHLTNGLYLVRVVSDHQTYTQQLMIAH
jgi:uncharacterized repeat protein (TIGR01451 family)